MITRIQKWGNSLGVRIPKGIATDVRVAEGESVELSVEAGRLVIAPVKRQKYELDKLLEQVSSENLPGEIDFGKPIGKEIW